MEDFERGVQAACEQALAILKRPNLKFRPMRRQGNRVNTERGFVIGRTNLRTGLITIDIYTPKKREPKKLAGILRTLCHEVAHHQKLPYRQRYRGRWIVRQHFPEFYRQVNKNIERLRNSQELGIFFANEKPALKKAGLREKIRSIQKFLSP
jgi:hypothetical protein